MEDMQGPAPVLGGELGRKRAWSREISGSSAEVTHRVVSVACCSERVLIAQGVIADSPPRAHSSIQGIPVLWLCHLGL